VCDVFVLEMYKAAGVFGSTVFQATEFTPKARRARVRGGHLAC
jgi:hypothetical protein